MSTNSTFTIISSGAPLVEVVGQGPSTDLAGGLGVPDGVPTVAPVDLLNAWVRVWRVDAQASVAATVAVTDTPFNLGAFVQLRRCASLVPLRPWWSRLVVVERWPWLRATLKRCAPSALALWYLFADGEPASTTNGARSRQQSLPTMTLMAESCTWENIGDDNQTQVNARGGDLVVVTFVTP